MSIELLVLAVASALRPTSLAVVYALLSAAQPRRLLLAFILAGVAFSCTVGIVVVAVIHDADLRHGTSNFDAVVNLLAGVAALGFAAGLAQGRLQRAPREKAAGGESRIPRRLRNPTLGVAAGAGAATHLPGLLYLVALNQISARDLGLAAGIANVLVFNAIWWSLPIVSLALFIMRPVATRDMLEAINDWVRAHDRQILIALFSLVGAYLTVRGAVKLFD